MHKVGNIIGEKEKVIGGYFTLGQLGWVCLGVFFGVAIGILTYFFIGWFCLIFALPCMLTGLPFAFYRKYDMPLFTYLRRKRRFKEMNKKYPNKRSGREMTFSTNEFISK